MREITSKTSAAFEAGRPFRNSNTAVTVSDQGVTLLLHGNPIARRNVYGGRLEINLCGWNTPTTRERLNGLSGVSVNTRKGELFLNGARIPSMGWVAVA
jgi:hypothetical protein